MPEPLDWVVFAEDAPDARMAQQLADATLVTRVDWADGYLEALRRWRGADDAAGFIKWAGLAELVRQRFPRLKVHGQFASKGEEAQARKALRVAYELGASAAVLVRDDDGKARRPDYEAAARALPSPPAALAVPAPMREAWLVSGFDPADEHDARSLDALRRDLGFDPRVSSHHLASGAEHDHSGRARPRHAKQVLARLTGGDADREAECLRDLTRLRQRGTENGLAAFLDDVERVLLPQLTDG